MSLNTHGRSLFETTIWRMRQMIEPGSAELNAAAAKAWPEGTIVGEDEQPKEFHYAQEAVFNCPRRIVAMVAGSQGGKTSFDPVWLWREILTKGPGDYIAATATYDLFKLKMLPALRVFFEDKLRIGRYWASDRIMEIADPLTGRFYADKSTSPMWGRVILRSAESLGGLESATGKAAVLDEAGQPKFGLDAYKAIKRRMSLHRGRILLSTTLYDPGWVDTEIIGHAKNGGKTELADLGEGGIVEITDNKKADIGVVQFDSVLNPMFPREEFELARASLPADEFEAFYRGRRIGSRTLVYDCFDRPMNTCPRFAIPDEGTRFMGLDFGGTNTAAVKVWEEPTSLRLYVYAEYLAGGRRAGEHADALLLGEPGRPVTYGGAASEGQWRTEFAGGKLPVRQPAVSDFDRGVNRVYATFKQRELIIFEDLTGLLTEIGTYRHKRDRFGNVMNEVEDKNSFHRLDALRYVISSIRPRRTGAKVVRLTE